MSTVHFTFETLEPVTGMELWKSDGTAAGTVLVKDINPGAASSTPVFLVNVNGTLFFQATLPSTGTELWKSDGTAAGTVLVKDIRPGPGSFLDPRTGTNINGTLYFSALGDPWKSDGTAAGTVPIKNIVPDAGSGGTVMVKDITPGAGSSSPANLINVNGALFFTARGPGTGIELWKSDGTDAGTVLVKDILPGTGSGLGIPPNFTNVNGTLFFTALTFTGLTGGKGLWKSDGTVMVIDLFPGALVTDSTPMSLTAFNGKLLFNGFNGVNGNELWISDGTASGTVLVKDIFPGMLGSIYPGNAQLSQVMLALSKSAVLAASDGITGLELWKTNGAGVGTILVQDILPGQGSSTPQQFVQSANQVFFTAFDLVHGNELWVAPLAALDVSLEEQIDQLLLLLTAPEIQNLKLPESLNSQLTNARGEVSSDNAPGQFVAARSHLKNFIKDLQSLVDTGNIAASQAQPLLDGANAILEQIEGNHPPKTQLGR